MGTVTTVFSYHNGDSYHSILISQWGQLQQYSHITMGIGTSDSILISQWGQLPQYFHITKVRETVKYYRTAKGTVIPLSSYQNGEGDHYSHITIDTMTTVSSYQNRDSYNTMGNDNSVSSYHIMGTVTKVSLYHKRASDRRVFSYNHGDSDHSDLISQEGQ